MANQIRELAFRYFNGNFTYEDMDAFIGEMGFLFDSGTSRYRNEAIELVGFAFYTKKAYSGVDNLDFVTTGLEVKLVGINTTIPQPSEFIFFPEASAPEGTSSVDLHYTQGQEIDFSSYIAAADAADTYNLLVNYNQSREFRLSFLDYEGYAMFKERFPLTSGYVGINYTRAAISMPILTGASASAYSNYRTLKFTPNPQPTSTGLLPEGIEDVAYRLGLPCPPVWYQSSPPPPPPPPPEDDGSPDNDGDGLRPLMFSTSDKKQDSYNDKPTCSCSCDLNGTEIDHSMVKQGIIPDEYSIPIKVGRYILIRLLIWTLIFILAGLLAWRGYVAVAGKAGLSE